MTTYSQNVHHSVNAAAAIHKKVHIRRTHHVIVKFGCMRVIRKELTHHVKVKMGCVIKLNRNIHHSAKASKTYLRKLNKTITAAVALATIAGQGAGHHMRKVIGKNEFKQ
jgi:hypothetical protein